MFAVLRIMSIENAQAMQKKKKKPLLFIHSPRPGSALDKGGACANVKMLHKGPLRSTGGK